MVPLVLSLIDHLPTPLEDQLGEELALLDVNVTTVRAPSFAGATLEQRLDLLRDRDVASPAAWLTVTDQVVRVSLATLAGSRANIRVVEVEPGRDAAAELALGIREILGQLGADAPRPPRDLAPKPRVGAGIVVPTTGLAAGPRALVEVGVDLRHRQIGGGGLLAVQVGDRQWRVGLGATGGVGPALLLAQLDVVHLPWVTWLQPRLGVGARLARRRLFGDARLAWAPRRDVVEEAGRAIYDSGRFEFTILIGLRQIARP